MLCGSIAGFPTLRFLLKGCLFALGMEVVSGSWRASSEVVGSIGLTELFIKLLVDEFFELLLVNSAYGDLRTSAVLKRHRISLSGADNDVCGVVFGCELVEVNGLLFINWLRYLPGHPDSPGWLLPCWLNFDFFLVIGLIGGFLAGIKLMLPLEEVYLSLKLFLLILDYLPRRLLDDRLWLNFRHGDELSNRLDRPRQLDLPERLELSNRLSCPNRLGRLDLPSRPYLLGALDISGNLYLLNCRSWWNLRSRNELYIDRNSLLSSSFPQLALNFITVLLNQLLLLEQRFVQLLLVKFKLSQLVLAVLARLKRLLCNRLD